MRRAGPVDVALDRVVVAVVAFSGFSAFLDGETSDGERGDGVEPPPAEAGEEREAGESAADNLRTGSLLGVGAEGGGRGRSRCGAWPRQGCA